MNNTENILKERQVPPPPMLLLGYEFMAVKKVAVTLTDIEKAFVKQDRIQKIIDALTKRYNL